MVLCRDRKLNGVPVVAVAGALTGEMRDATLMLSTIPSTRADVLGNDRLAARCSQRRTERSRPVVSWLLAGIVANPSVLVNTCPLPRHRDCQSIDNPSREVNGTPGITFAGAVILKPKQLQARP